MVGFLLTTLITALSLLVADILLPGFVIATFPAALLAAIAVGVVNSFIKPVLSILTLPINILSLGAFSLVLNGLCFWLASLVVPGFGVHGLLAFIVGPIVVSLASTFLNKYFVEKGIGQRAIEG